MPAEPELEAFRRNIRALRKDPRLAPLIHKGAIAFSKLSLADVQELIQNESVYYFLIAAAGLNRTTVKKAMKAPGALIVPKQRRRAYVIRDRLPPAASFAAVEGKAVALRTGDLKRKRGGGIEGLFRERLRAEAIPIFMSPPIPAVPGLLIDNRKPDGVYPDPATGLPPRLYLEIKNVRRVADDIQKRLYEIAEASLEMKLLYGSIKLTGLGVSSLDDVAGNTLSESASAARSQTRCPSSSLSSCARRPRPNATGPAPRHSSIASSFRRKSTSACAT